MVFSYLQGGGGSRRDQFGSFNLDAPERRLVRDGVEIPLPHKVFTTLRLLVENAGRLLTREQLLEKVWPDVAVEEENLNHNISILRKTLGEQATPGWIRPAS